MKIPSIARRLPALALLLLGASLAAAQDEVRVKIKTPDEREFATLRVRGSDVKIEFVDGGTPVVLRGKAKDSGKRKYEREGAGPLAEVKAGDDGFKLRTPDGKLLWKVKIAPDKIKISDNEENANPFELKRKGDDVEVRAAGAEIGKVKFYADRGKIKVKNAAEGELYESNTDRASVLHGVLLMERIPLEQRLLLMAELLARGL